MSNKEMPAQAPPSAPDACAVYLHKEGWETSFKGFTIVSCAVRDKNTVYFAMIEIPEGESCDDNCAKLRMGGLYLNEIDLKERWFHQGLSDFMYPLAGGCSVPCGQGMIVSRNGDTFAAGSKKTGREKIGDRKNPPVIMSVRQIKGRSYAAGYNQEIYRRQDVGVWEKLPSTGLPKMGKNEFPLNYGFTDVDGFAENDPQ